MCILEWSMSKLALWLHLAGRSVGLQPQSKPCVRANGPNDVIKSTYQSELNSSKLNQLNGEMNQTFVELRPTNLQENQLRNDTGQCRVNANQER